MSVPVVMVVEVSTQTFGACRERAHLPPRAQLRNCWSRNRHQSVCRKNTTLADGNPRAQHSVVRSDAEQAQCLAHPHNVADSVASPHLVEVNGIDGSSVNMSFGVGEAFKNSQRA